MILEAWRLVKAKHADTAFSGEGAAKFGGRWNSRGTRVVYTSASRALAALENLVHINPPVMFDYVIMQVQFDAALVTPLPATDLPYNWRQEPPPAAVQTLGDAWALARKSAVLAVPSAIIPGELNYLLNPLHSDFGSISLGKPLPFEFDPRLLA